MAALGKASSGTFHQRVARRVHSLAVGEKVVTNTVRGGALFGALRGTRYTVVRGNVVNTSRTYGTHKNLYVFLFSPNNIWSYLLWPPVIGKPKRCRRIGTAGQRHKLSVSSEVYTTGENTPTSNTQKMMLSFRVFYAEYISHSPRPPPTAQ